MEAKNSPQVKGLCDPQLKSNSNIDLKYSTFNDILEANYADVDGSEILWVCIYGVHNATVTHNVYKLYVLCGWEKREVVCSKQFAH